MAGRTLNRRVLREQAEHATKLETLAPETGSAELPPPTKKRAKAKAAAVPKVRKPRKVKAPPRLRARWGVFNNSMKQVAIFDYNQRAAADEKLADLRTNQKGMHFLQIVKEAIVDEAPVLALA